MDRRSYWFECFNGVSKEFACIEEEAFLDNILCVANIFSPSFFFINGGIYDIYVSLEERIGCPKFILSL